MRIPDSNNGTAATTRVLIDTQNHHTRWSTVGAGVNIIQASWLALVDSVEYGLTLAQTEHMNNNTGNVQNEHTTANQGHV